MAATALPALTEPAERPGVAKGIVHALAADRTRRATRALRRNEVFIHETALVHGRLRAIGLAEADALPFNG